MRAFIESWWLGVLRLGFGLLGLATVFILMVDRWDAPGFRVANYFSFFTIQSNLLAAAMLLYGAARIWRPETLPRRDALRGAVLIYLSLTGIVYGVLLSGDDEALQTALPWANNVLHRIIPLVMVADWLLDRPRTVLTWRQARWWLVYPLAYVVYSLIRGPIVDWYPYPFLDPNESGGYLGVAAYCVGITIGVLLASWVILWSSRRWAAAPGTPSASAGATPPPAPAAAPPARRRRRAQARRARRR